MNKNHYEYWLHVADAIADDGEALTPIRQRGTTSLFGIFGDRNKPIHGRN